MPAKKFTQLKLFIFTSLIIGLTTGCKSNDIDSPLPLSVIYGGVVDKKKSIYLADEQGKRRVKVLSATLSDGYPAIAPNGTQFAFYGKYDKYKTWSIHTANIDGSNLRRLTSVKNVWDSSPTWSPDGKTIAFAREFKGDDGKMVEQIWLMDADGSNKRQIKSLKGRSPEFMQDGRLLFQTIIGPSQIAISDIDGTNVIQLTNDDSNNMSPKVSPDGKQIAYLSNRDGNQEVYLMDLDGSNQIRLTRNSITDWGPAWSIDGSKVYFSTQNVRGFYDIYKVDKDGTSPERMVSNASQSGSLFHVDRQALEAMVNSRNK